MKRIVIIFAALIMLTGITISVMKTLQIGPFADKSPAPQQAEAASAEPPRFVEVEQILVPIFTGDRVAATVQIQIKLQTNGAQNEARIARLMPRISDAFLREMHGFLPRLLQREEKLNVQAIRQRLMLVGDKIVGEKVIDDVLIQSITDNPVPNRR